MDRRQIGFKLTMDQLGLEVKLADFDDRLILQKAMYLAQAAGVQLGYFYRWYLRGPYCPAVADDAFAVSMEDPDEAKNWKLDRASVERLEKLGGLTSIEDRAEKGRKLELLASVHFLIDRKQVKGRSSEAIAKVLRRNGKDFDEADVGVALGELRAHGILG